MSGRTGGGGVTSPRGTSCTVTHCDWSYGTLWWSNDGRAVDFNACLLFSELILGMHLSEKANYLHISLICETFTTLHSNVILIKDS